MGVPGDHLGMTWAASGRLGVAWCAWARARARQGLVTRGGGLAVGIVRFARGRKAGLCYSMCLELRSEPSEVEGAQASSYALVAGWSELGWRREKGKREEGRGREERGEKKKER